MAILKIAKMGHPVLRRRAEPVSDARDPEIARLVADMIETMADARGAGLAAPQIYQSKRIVIFHAPSDRGEGQSAETAPLTVLINPEIEVLDGTRVEDWEGCLSIPGLRGRVPRASHIRYKGFGPDGAAIEREATGFHARVVQHEVDHLDGVLYPERMADLGSLTFDSELVHVLQAEKPS